MRILIAEEALQSGKGHWPSYIGDIAAGLRAMGDEVDVLVHRQATATVLERVGGTPWFSRNSYAPDAPSGGKAGLQHSWIFYCEMRAWLKKSDAYDHVLVLTMRIQHLMGLALLLRRLPKAARRTHFVMLFVQGFGEYVGPGQLRAFPATPTTRMARICFRSMRQAVAKGRLSIVAETMGMRAELERLSGSVAVYLPHAVEFPVVQSRSHAAAVDAASQAGSSPALPVKRRWRIGCPGFARYEKGSDLLYAAACQLIDSGAADNVEIVMQWPEPFALPDGTMLEPQAPHRDHPALCWVNDNLDTQRYLDLMASFDAVILPYRLESYQLRVSRVAIEAAIMGKPLIYMQDTWTEEVADAAGCGVAIANESVAAICAALNEFIATAENLCSHAGRNADAVRQHYSVATFRQGLQ